MCSTLVCLLVVSSTVTKMLGRVFDLTSWLLVVCSIFSCMFDRSFAAGCQFRVSSTFTEMFCHVLGLSLGAGRQFEFFF